jgi:hypothetical protein
LDWALQRMFVDDRPINDDQIASALSMESGKPTSISLRLSAQSVPITRLDAALAPAQLNFVRDPQP